MRHTPTRRGALLVALAAALPLSVHAQVRQQGTPALGVDSTNFDRAVRPQDDFFRFVNGGWLARSEIPADRSRWGAFDQLREQSREALHTILEEAAASKAAHGTTQQKAGDMYAAYLDTVRIERLGITPLRPELDRIAALRSASQLPATFAYLQRAGVGGVFGGGVAQDPKNSSQYIVSVGQGGLGLPDRDYYLKNDAKLVAARQAYVTYLTTLLRLAQQPDPEGAAQRIVALETEIAKVQWDRARLRDRNATYNKMTVGELAALSPNYDWKGYLAAAKLGAAKAVVVRQPDYVKALDGIITATPIGTWRELLTARLLSSYANELPKAFDEAAFAYRGKALSGQLEQAARWKRAVDETEGILGEPLGKLYVDRYFKADAKQRMDALVKNLIEAYRVGIDSLEWMSPATKAEAKAKLARFTVKIGYPDRWRDYSKLEIRRDDLIGNVRRAAAFQYDESVARLGQPVERWRWGMTPQTVNAYYNSVNNEIVFPAAILQPPFFDVNADDAVNYGAIGAVIGHEIGHGFDDQGRKSDGDGNLRDWWTADDAKAFDERASRLGAQYAALMPIDSLRINPKLTMGENIGDLSGLAQAYRAYRMSLGGKEAPVIGGFTGDQRFFMGYAQIWRAKMRDEALRNQLMTDPHSPGMARAFVPLTNNDAFLKAFDVKPGDRMYRAPEERVKIW
ncbi:MAG TPA: M13 family metallopeptidase [Gemmatimonadaceae bacterium]